MEDISVVICGYAEERFEDIVAAVESVQRQSLLPTEIIVIIDYNLHLQRRVQERLPQITIIENSDVKGLSGARNTGTQLARGPIVAYLDDDAVAQPDWLRHLCSAFENPWVLGTGGRLTPLWLKGKPAWFPEEFYWVFGCSYQGMCTGVAKIRNPIGANMAIRKEVFDSIGGFRNEIGRIGARLTGCEETEFCIRARQRFPQGYFLFAPMAHVLHKVPSGRTSWKYFCGRCYNEGLSKAVVTRLVGTRDGLAAERNYTLHALPCGVIRGAYDALIRHEPSGLIRAWAIIVGLVLTLNGYTTGHITRNADVMLRGFQP